MTIPESGPLTAVAQTDISRTNAQTSQDVLLREAANELEAVFLAEMLKSAGLDAKPGAFGGGEGEEQFGSLLRMEQARIMVDGGGIGLAESLFRAMQEQTRAE